MPLIYTQILGASADSRFSALWQDPVSLGQGGGVNPSLGVGLLRLGTRLGGTGGRVEPISVPTPASGGFLLVPALVWSPMTTCPTGR